MSSAVPVRHEEGEHPHERLDECRHPISVDRDFVVLAPTLTLTRPGMATRRPSAFIAGAYLALRSPTSHATPVIDVASPWAKDLDTLSISPSEPRTTGRTSSLANQAARDMPSLSHPLSPNLQHAVTSPGALSCGLFEAFAICSRCQRGTLSAPSPSRCGQQRRLTARTAYSMFFSSSGLPPVVALRSRHDRVPVREDDHDGLPDQHSRIETFLLSRQLSGPRLTLSRRAVRTADRGVPVAAQAREGRVVASSAPRNCASRFACRSPSSRNERFLCSAFCGPPPSNWRSPPSQYVLERPRVHRCLPPPPQTQTCTPWSSHKPRRTRLMLLYLPTLPIPGLRSLVRAL